MPAYAALSDLLERFEEREIVQLTDDAGNGSADEVVADRALNAATGTIDSYLAATYQLPLARVPANIVDICCDIARFKLWQRKGSPTEAADKAHTAAIKTLEKISQGTLKIDAGMREQPAREGAIVVEGGNRVFDRDRMGGF